VSRVITISSRRRSYDALKAILLTLWVSHLVGTPVRCSRRKNDYVRDARYGQVYFKYDRIIPPSTPWKTGASSNRDWGGAMTAPASAG
jgi:hypothetical protein